MREKGFSPIIVIVGLVALFIAASAGAYYFLKFTGKSPYEKLEVSTISPTPSQAAISTSEDPKVIEKEIDDTTINSIDTDINNLETSASAL